VVEVTTGKSKEGKEIWWWIEEVERAAGHKRETKEVRDREGYAKAEEKR